MEGGIHRRLCVHFGIDNLNRVGVFHLFSSQKRRGMLVVRMRGGVFLI